MQKEEVVEPKSILLFSAFDHRDENRDELITLVCKSTSSFILHPSSFLLSFNFLLSLLLFSGSRIDIRK
jgi:hypothetical protein